MILAGSCGVGTSLNQPSVMFLIHQNKDLCRAGPSTAAFRPYDDMKDHEGQLYTGMRVGSTHDWDYRGDWSEEKTGPLSWLFRFVARKTRKAPAPEMSRAPVGSKYHWLLLGEQVVEKVDKDNYETEFSGLKLKIGHKRPHWKQWSYFYENQDDQSIELFTSLGRTSIEILDLQDPMHQEELLEAVQSVFDEFMFEVYQEEVEA